MEEQEIAKKNLILKMEVGSNMYGTFTPASDKDYMGVFIPPEEYILGNKKCEQVEDRTNSSGSGRQNTNKDVDTIIYSLPKYFHLLAANNPNVIETLFVPLRNIQFQTDLGKKILMSSPIFVSKKVKHTFLGYAFTQRKSLTHKRERFEVLKDALDKLYDLDEQGIEVLDDRLNLVSKLREDGTWGQYEKGQKVQTVVKLIEDEVNKYGHRLELIRKFGYDTKYASHLIRLLDEGLQLLVEGHLTLPLTQNNLIRDIKLGKYKLDKVLKMADDKEKLVEQAYINSKLQHTPDLKAISDLQIVLLKEYWGWSSPLVVAV